MHKDKQTIGPYLETVIITALFTAVCFIYCGQQRISFNNGQGWDGVSYYKIIEQIQQGKNLVAGELPYIKRIGTHFLVGTCSRITGKDLLTTALLINLLGTFITVLLLSRWLRLYIDSFPIRGLLIILFITAWFTPLRFSFFYPMTTDSWGAAWFIGSLLLLHRIRKSYNQQLQTWWTLPAYSLVVAIGYLFRESNVILIVTPFFLINPLKYFNLLSPVTSIRQLIVAYRGKISFLWLLPAILLGCTHMLASSYTTIIPSGYSYIKIMAHWLYYKSTVEYTLGLCIAYGPLLLLLPFFYKHYKHILIEQQELLFLLFVALILGWTGGSDTERITYMSSFPIVLVLMGICIKNIFNSTHRWWFYVLLVLQTIAYRFYWHLPDYPNATTTRPLPFFTYIGTDFQNLFLYSRHGDYLLNCFLLIEYLILLVLTFNILNNKKTVRLFNA